jgi:hypothetical protein
MGRPGRLAGRLEGKVALIAGGAAMGASPAEISTFVVFLVSDESAYATGASSSSTAG